MTKTTNITRRITAAAIACAGFAGVIFGIGAQFSVLWAALTGLVGLWLLGDMDELKRKFSLKGYGIGLGLALAALVLSSVLNLAFNHHAAANPITGSSLGFALIPLVIIPSLIGEELFTLVLFKAAGGGAIGWTVSTLLFAAAHGFEYHWNIWQLLGVVFARLVFTFIMKRYGVQTSAALHITYDTLLFLPIML